MSKEKKPKCCKIGCDEFATKAIQPPNDPYNYTHSCDEHWSELCCEDDDTFDLYPSENLQ